MKGSGSQKEGSLRLLTVELPPNWWEPISLVGVLRISLEFPYSLVPEYLMSFI